MKKTYLLLIFLQITLIQMSGQFAPQYPLPGNTAVHKTDTSIKKWAMACEVTRGPRNIADPGIGNASTGSDMNATGNADNMIVSLGDGGSARLSFDISIRNGNGPDFVVFENGFADPDDPSMSFMELAFVEVSSDGIHFVRFPATSNTQTDSQVKNESYSDVSYINNLAGKYISGYGTPFDLEELKDSSDLNINDIRYIRIIDVVGSLDEAYASYDQYGNKINDPWPTEFPGAGFDLDAVGVIHYNGASGADEPYLSDAALHVFPIPTKGILHIEGDFRNTARPLSLYDMNGRLFFSESLSASRSVDIGNVPSGTYILQIGSSSRLIIKQ